MRRWDSHYIEGQLHFGETYCTRGPQNYTKEKIEFPKFNSHRKLDINK